jgi:hypothetical protein
VSCRATSSPIFDANCIGVNDKNDEKKEWRKYISLVEEQHHKSQETHYTVNS